MGPGKRDLLSAVIKRPKINKKKNKTEIRFRTFSHGILQQQRNYLTDPRNGHWRRPWRVGRGQPSGRIWQ